MKITTIITRSLIGVFLIFSACTKPAPVTPAPAIPEPKGFTISDLKIPVLDESSGEGVEIGVTVTNNGEKEGTHTLVLLIDGSVVETKEVTLAGGTRRDVTFTISVTRQGVHKVTIEQLTGELMWPGHN